MSAAPYAGTLILRGRTKGKVMHLPIAATDVNLAYWTFTDGSSQVQLPIDDDYYIADLIVVTGGTDTSTVEVFKNQLDAGIRINVKSNLSTTIARQFQANPVGFQAGSMLKFQQLT